MSRNQIIENLKRLLACSKRQQTVGDDTFSAHSCADSDKPGETSPDLMVCQEALTLQNVRQRMRIHKRVSMETCSNRTHVTESPKTLSGGTLTVEYKIARAQRKLNLARNRKPKTVEHVGMFDDRPVNISSRRRRAAGKVQLTGELQQRGFHAEICLLDCCDHRCQVNDEFDGNCAVVRPDDLIVTHYLPAKSLMYKQTPKIMNNIHQCYQCQLNSEVCDVGNNRLNTSTLESTELDIPVTKKLSNRGVIQPSSCWDSTQMNACRRSMLRLQKMSDMSEPKSVYVSMASSENEQFNFVATNIAVDPWVRCKPENEMAPNSLESANVTAGTNKFENTYIYDQDQTPQHCPRSRTALSGRCKGANSTIVSQDRFGVMSNDLCLSLSELSSGTDLVERYLEKRNISETTRIRHEQRRGRMKEDALRKIFTAAAASDTGNILQDGASSLTYKSATTLATSHGYPDLGWSALSQFKDAAKSTSSTAMAEPVLTSSALGFGFPDPNTDQRSWTPR